MPEYKLQKKAREFLSNEPTPRGTFRHIVYLFVRNRLNEYEDGEASINSVSRTCNTLIAATRVVEQIVSAETKYATIRGRIIKKAIEILWQRYSYNSMRTIIMDLRSFGRWAYQNEHHDMNITRMLKPPKRRVSRKRARAVPPTDEHVHQVMRHLATQLTDRGLLERLEDGTLWHAIDGWRLMDQKALRDLFILTFMYETGIRAGELSRLGSAAVQRTTETAQKTYEMYAFGKTNERKRLFTESSAELWRVWWVIRPKLLTHLAVIGWRNGEDAGPFEPHGISTMLKRRCEESGLAKKHHFATQALRSAKARRALRTVGPDVARHLLDHSLLETTLNYDHVDDREYEAAILSTGLTEKII